MILLTGESAREYRIDFCMKWNLKVKGVVNGVESIAHKNGQKLDELSTYVILVILDVCYLYLKNVYKNGEQNYPLIIYCPRIRAYSYGSMVVYRNIFYCLTLYNYGRNICKNA